MIPNAFKPDNILTKDNSYRGAVAEWSYRSVPRQFWRTILISKQWLRAACFNPAQSRVK